MAWTDIFDRDFEKRVRTLMAEWRIPGVAVVLVPDEDGVEPIYFTHTDGTLTDKAITKEACQMSIKHILYADP